MGQFVSESDTSQSASQSWLRRCHVMSCHDVDCTELMLLLSFLIPGLCTGLVRMVFGMAVARGALPKELCCLVQIGIKRLLFSNNAPRRLVL